jgi:FkbM family methyltransferase
VVFPISEVIPQVETIKIVDVGAMSIGDGEEPYADLLKAAPCHVVGFEPNESELATLQSAGWIGRTFLPHFIGDGSEQTFYLCRAPMTSSLLQPDAGLLDYFQGLGELMKLANARRVSTMRLDDIPEVAGTDFLKLDIQGGEGMALAGATTMLRDVVLVHTEVEFVPLYRRQPLFGDIDAFLRAQGFTFHRFTSMSGGTFKPMIYRNDPSAAMSQSLWGDAVFVRDFRTFRDVSPMKLLKLATILHENYRSMDLAALALAAYDAQMGTSIQPAYIGRFSPPVVQ